MQKIEPNAVYTKSSLAKTLGKSYNTVSSWWGKGLKHKGRYTTGRAVLDFFESDIENEAEEVNLKLERKLSKVL